MVSASPPIFPPNRGQKVLDAVFVQKAPDVLHLALSSAVVLKESDVAGRPACRVDDRWSACVDYLTADRTANAHAGPPIGSQVD